MGEGGGQTARREAGETNESAYALGRTEARGPEDLASEIDLSVPLRHCGLANQARLIVLLQFDVTAVAHGQMFARQVEHGGTRVVAECAFQL